MRITVVSGSGLSASAGIPTYRGDDGAIWNDTEFETMSHASRYGNHLDLLWPKWLKLHEMLSVAEPTKAHYAIADLGAIVLTQNLDRLHLKSGTPAEKHFEVHGSIFESTCLRCKKSFETPSLRECPNCGSDRVRPDFVLFGERIRHRKKAEEILRKETDVAIFIGTSGTVSPVSEWTTLAPRTVLVDPKPWGTFDAFFELTSDEWADAGCPID